MNSYRQLIRHRWWISVLDVGGHLLLGYLLPGHWWWQWLPDLPVPLMMFWSWQHDRVLPPESRVLLVYNRLHQLWYPLVLLVIGDAYVVGGFPEKKWMVALAMQWIAHQVWDHLTHPEPEFRRAWL